MAVKKKKLTNAEKKLRREIKQEMIESGLIKPDKKKLNGRKYIDETIELWNKSESRARIYIIAALSYMLGHYDRNFKTDKEAVGAAKVLRIALKLAEFDNKLEEEGRTTYKVSEQFDYIKDIFEE